MILTIPRTQAPALPEAGCWPTTHLDFLQPSVWHARSNVENDESFLQPIVYLVLQNAQGQAWCYQRTGGDARLEGRRSCGVGGHVDFADSADSKPQDPFDAALTLQTALLRELAEELQISPDEVTQVRRTLELRGLIYEGISPVGRVHLGVLYTAKWPQAELPQPRMGEKLDGLGFLNLATIATDPRFELWSQLAAQYLMPPTP